MKNIYYTKPSITQIEEKYVCDAIKNGWGDKCYDYIFKFQDKFNKYIGTQYSIATSSCTGAIHLSLSALGITSNDEVIVPDTTWIASVSPVTYLGAKPVFVDISKDNWCINPQKIREAITSKTKAIICVHLYGNICEMDEILEIAREYNLKVIEDCAEALGSEYKGKKVGSIGDIGVFSFHGTKTMTTGEGGMIVTNNTTIIEELNILSNHGREVKNHSAFWMSKIGFKYKISNIQAALGLAQIERIVELVEKKRKVFQWYKERLENNKNIKLNIEKIDTVNSYWMPTIIIDNIDEDKKNKIIKEMMEKGVQVRTFFYPVSLFDMFETKSDNKVAYNLYKKGINLPSYYDITEDEIEYVVERLLNILEEMENSI
jgi:perosamine synthetase